MRDWLAGVVGENLAPIVSVVLSAAIVVLLALAIITLAKRVFAGSGGIGGRSRAPRLAILDVTAVDPKRKLVLVRRDDTEHLILIGGQNDVVVESGIQRVRTRRVDPAPAGSRVDPEPAAEPVATPQPRRAPVAALSVAPPRPAPPLASEPVQVDPTPARAVSQRGERETTEEPADLRIAPVSRAVPQDAPAAPIGERQVTARPAAEPARTPEAASPAAAPPLPAFLGVLTQRPASPAAPSRQPATAAPASPPAAKPVARPSQSDPVAIEPKPKPEAAGRPASLASPPAPVQPRSMATPTLPPAAPTPSQSHTNDGDSTRDKPDEAPPMLLADEPLLPTEEPRASTPTPARNTEPGEREASRAVDQPPSPERQPLSVRSFATTIQARRTPTPIPPVASPVEPSQPTAAAPATDRDEPVSEPAQSGTASAPARQLTLEEEMERLLHDFTLDVSDRR